MSSDMGSVRYLIHK